MIRLLKTFFQPKVETYTYDSTKDVIKSKINEIFTKSSNFWSGNDMRGDFISTDTFEIRRISGAMGSYGYRPKLIGQILSSQIKTEIKTTIRTSFLFYFWFFATIIFGFGGIYEYFQTSSLNTLIGSIAIIVIGPTMTIVISNFKVGILTDRYKRYIDSQLKK